MKNETPSQAAGEIPSPEGKLRDLLAAIDPTRNDALEQVKSAMDRNYSWSRQTIDPYDAILDNIRDHFRQILDQSTTSAGRKSLYAEIQNFIDRLPEISGLREKVRDITRIPELEGSAGIDS